MGSLGELLATDHRQALEFFVQRLKDICGPDTDRLALLYNASILAHCAQVSTQAGVDMATPADLGVVFHRFVVEPAVVHDSQTLEAAAAQCLLLAGFFEEQMRRRHNLRWYGQLGAAFFRRAAVQESLPQRARLFNTLASDFEGWRRRQAQLARDLRDQPFLLS